MKKLKSIVNNSYGRTLIEILASITILAIVVIPLTSAFIQSARANFVSEEIMDATYVAQAQMEEVINGGSTFINSDYDPIDENNFEKITDNYKVTINLKVTPNTNDLFRNVLIIVTNLQNGRLEAQMETIIRWE